MRKGLVVLGFVLLMSVGFVFAECVDTDTGRDYNVLGEVSLDSSDMTYKDTCELGKLKEYYCEGNEVKDEIIDCHCASSPGLNGVCLETSVCEDSEDPSGPRWYQDEYTKGIITITYMNGAGFKQTDKVIDECVEDNNLVDYSCSPSDDAGTFFGTGFGNYIKCENGCNDGACIQEVEVPTEEPSDCTDTDGGIDYYEKGYLNNHVGVNFEDYCLGDSSDLIERYCTKDPNKFTQQYDCPNGCSNGACIKGEQIREQITCYFVNSEKEQKCYIAGGYTNQDEGTKFCYGKETCIIKFSGYKGEKITWKSTCGGYDYSIMDGVDNNIDFDCNEGETDEGEIKRIWFRSAYWQCYDKEEQKSEDSTSCKSSETWKKYAQDFCEGHCYKDGSKCGVNSFSVSNECYPEVEIVNQITEEGVEPLEESWEEEILICKNSCALGDKCYPFGFRKDGRYCSDETNFVDYKEGKETCDNNFECKSNLCVNSECISQGFLKRIMNWFSRLFGGD